MKNVGNISRGRSQGVPKILSVPCIARAHCAVIFAIAQLSCISTFPLLGYAIVFRVHLFHVTCRSGLITMH